VNDFRGMGCRMPFLPAKRKRSMDAVALIVPDIHFPYELFEAALAYAKEYEAEFRAIFLTNQVMRFAPGDLMERQEGADSTCTIAQHLRLLQKRAAACHLPFRSFVLTAPTLEQVVIHTGDVDRAYFDAGDASLFEDWSFTCEELLESVPYFPAL
jgi:hypothetical protein